ncbi:DoxX family membrane protein [Pedobacter fastidiosus]|uniref:DoxX family membrane protein n=1 Tax=Pedobacter fastidiosus TaxID=2765361 RepID=A0ABR7KRR1_9SPHI|nr:DoxX family membrane protein [Pedobacter fastidiosus]MBC6110790.1 DoxX family membrane protein [Pedobacter fastidiosus]
MKIAIIIVRLLLGALFVFGAVVYFFHIPMEEPAMSVDQKTFMSGVMASVYLFPLIKATELICGLALVIGRFVPLAVVVIFPVTLNIFLYHAFLGPKDLPMAVILLLANLFLAYAYRKNYTTLLVAK